MQTITPLTADDLARLDEQVAVVAAVVAERYGAALARDRADLVLLQRIVDEGVLARAATYQLQCLGIVLGHVFAQQTSLRWAIVEDEYGRDPALHYPGTTVVVFPLTMISKRVEDDRAVDVVAIFDAVAADVERMAVDPRYRSPPKP